MPTSIPFDLKPRSQVVFTLEGSRSPWGPSLVWLEHRKPDQAPRDLKKGITATVALRWGPTPTTPKLEAWRQTVIVTNETSENQPVTVHAAIADDVTSGALTLDLQAEYALD